MKLNLDLIANKGIKLTKHKLAILKLFNQHRHLDANGINLILREQGNSVSIATIYRVLSSFEAHNVIVRHTFNDELSVYELANPDEHHDHLICVKCNKVIEFFNCQIEKIQEQIAKKNNFIIVNHHLNLYGICSKCQKLVPTDSK
jgi:Fur family transcriptional regulator, ferric uptake regulator